MFKSRWQIFFFFLLVIVVGLFFWAPKSQLRQLSSDSDPVKSSLGSASNRFLEVHVVPVGGVPENDEQELTLKGTVILHQMLSGDLEYRWILPPEAHLVEGELEDSWADLPLNRPMEVKVTITGVSHESPGNVVVLRVQNSADGQPIGTSATFTPGP